MNKVQEKSRIANVMEYARIFFEALSVNKEYINDSEDEIKKSGNDELIKSMEDLKKLETMFKDTEISKNKIKTNLKNIEKEQVKSPKITKATIHEKEKSADNELEL